MRLASATVGPFKSISNAQTVTLDQITVFVGMNEAGKTVFLQALQKSRDALNLAKFDPVEDYPRRHLRTYIKEYKEKVAGEATRLTYELNPDELKALNTSVKTDVKEGFTFSVIHRYDNTTTTNIDIDERPVLEHRAVSTSLRQPGSAFTVATPRHRRGATTTDRAAVAAGQRPHAASRPGCRSSVLGHPGGWFSTAD